MKKVITYGTYDLLHQGHINRLKRTKDGIAINYTVNGHLQPHNIIEI